MFIAKMCAPHALANFTLGIKIPGLIYNQGYFYGSFKLLSIQLFNQWTQRSISRKIFIKFLLWLALVYTVL